MTRMRNIALGGLAALVMSGAASAAFAEEPGTFQNRLNGATIGLPLGAAPPPGLYTGLETAYLGLPATGHGNQVNGLQVNAIAQAVPLLWVPGWNFLGASYSMSAVVAFYEAEVLGAGITQGGNNLLATDPTATVYVFANPLWNPISLSWNLGQGWFVSAGFNFVAPIGTNASNFTNPDYWTFEPTLAISYLANNWVLSANMFYDFNTASGGNCCIAQPTGTVGLAPGNGYVSGDAFYADFTAVYKIGKWEIGPVGYLEAQTTSDSPGGGLTCADVAGTAFECGNYFDFALGGLVGYDFGPVDLQVWVTEPLTHSNSIDGLSVWTRLGFRLWGPEAPKPLVAKD